MLGLGATVATPVLAHADNATMPVIGFLHSAWPAAWAARVAAFKTGLGQVGTGSQRKDCKSAFQRLSWCAPMR
jgi:hypothetical protein